MDTAAYFQPNDQLPLLPFLIAVLIAIIGIVYFSINKTLKKRELLNEEEDRFFSLCDEYNITPNDEEILVELADKYNIEKFSKLLTSEELFDYYSTRKIKDMLYKDDSWEEKIKNIEKFYNIRRNVFLDLSI